MGKLPREDCSPGFGVQDRLHITCTSCVCVGCFTSPYSPVNIQMDPPQIATEGFSSDALSERSPEQHTKNRGKSRRANIIFFAKIQNGGQNHNFVYYSAILKTNEVCKMY